MSKIQALADRRRASGELEAAETSAEWIAFDVIFEFRSFWFRLIPTVPVYAVGEQSDRIADRRMARSIAEFHGTCAHRGEIGVGVPGSGEREPDVHDWGA